MKKIERFMKSKWIISEYRLHQGYTAWHLRINVVWLLYSFVACKCGSRQICISVIQKTKAVRFSGVDSTTLLEAIMPFFPIDRYCDHAAMTMGLTESDKAKGMPDPAVWAEYDRVIKSIRSIKDCIRWTETNSMRLPKWHMPSSRPAKNAYTATCCWSKALWNKEQMKNSDRNSVGVFVCYSV